MLTIFGAMCVAMVMIIRAAVVGQLVILLSVIPIALISNVIRIVTTALLYMAFGQETAWLNKIIHDWAGFAMMPIGLGLLWIELAILSRLTIPVERGIRRVCGPRHGRGLPSTLPIRDVDVAESRLGTAETTQIGRKRRRRRFRRCRPGGCITLRHVDPVACFAAPPRGWLRRHETA